MSGKILKNRITRRTLSTILAISMLIGALPSFALANDAVSQKSAYTYTLFYNFMKGFTGDTSYTSASSVTYDMTTAGSGSEVNSEIFSEPWAFQSTTSSQSGNSYFKYNGSNYGISMHHKGIGCIKIKVPTAGKYIPKMRFNSGTSIKVTTALYAYDIETDTKTGNPIAQKEITVDGTDDYALCDTAVDLTSGEYVVSIQTTKDGYSAIIDGFKLVVEPRDLIYDFMKGYTGDKSYTSASSISYAMITAGSGDEINTAMPSDPWAFQSTTSSQSGNSYFKYNGNSYGISMHHKGIGRLKIKVPADGKYIPKMRFNGGTSIAVTTALYAYDAKTDAVTGDPIVEQKNMEINGTDDYALSDIPVMLTAGEYVVSIQTTKDGYSAIIDGFKLLVASELPNLSAELPQADGLLRVNVNESTKTPLAVEISDLSKLDYTALSIETSFEPEGIAEAEVIKNENGAAIAVSGLAEGTSVMTILVSQDGANAASTKVNIAVSPKGTVAKVHDLFYNFKKAWTGNTSADYPKTITSAMMTNGSISEVNPNILSDTWAFFQTSSKGGNNYFKFNDKGYGLCKSQEGSGSLKIKVPVSGNYQPAAVLYKGTEIPVNVRFSKYDAVADSEGEVIASKDITVDGTKDYALTDDQIPLEAGEYIVTLSHAATPGLAMIDGFKLTNMDKKLLVSGDEIRVKKDEQTETALTITDFSGAAIPPDKLTYSITVADETIATALLNEKDNVLVVCAKGLALGSTIATIQVSTADGKFGEFRLPITTTADFELDITMDIPDQIKVGQSVDIPIGVRYMRDGADGGDAPADVQIAISNALLTGSVSEGEGKINNTLKLTGAASGTACLTVTIQVADVIETRKIPILIYNDSGKPSKSYQYMIWRGIPEKTELSHVDTFLKTMPGSGEELRPNAETDTWCYAGQSEKSTFVNNYDSYGSALEMGIGSWGSIKIRLPESGIYQAITQNALYPMAGILRVYIAPVDAENPRDPKYSLGSKDTYIPGDKNTITPVHHTALRTVALDAGDYIVTWENVGRNPDCIASAARLYIGGFILKPTESLPEITLTAGEVPDMRQYATVEVPLTASVSDGTDEDIYGAEFEITPSVPNIADAKTVTKGDGTTVLSVTGVGAGTTELNVQMKIRGTLRASVRVPVKILEPGKLTRVSVGVLGSELNTIPLHEIDLEKNRAQLEVHIFDENNEEISAESAAVQNASYVYASKNESLAVVDQTGMVFAVMPGEVTVTVAVTMNGITKTGQAVLNITQGKSKSSYYTEERVANMRENAERYPWASSAKNAAVKSAEKYIGEEERLWNVFTTQELPRSYYVGYRGDPNAAVCRYCGCDISAKYGSMYGWLRDGWEEPWKVQCPDCRRKFPSNDFGSFYQLGIDEEGNWRYKLAKENNAKLVAQGEDGYLKNVLYPEKNTESEPNWGVDDGYGYDTGRTYSNGIKEVHTYISFYNHWGVWHSGIIRGAMEALESAYLYTGDPRYGRVGAIMMDRLADVYPDMDTAPYRFQLTANGSYKPHGKVVDYIWENQLAQEYSRAYDAFYPMYDDPYVIRFLSDKAKKYNMPNDKSTARLIRTNCEDGILREIFRSAKIGNIYGNFGMYQSTVALAAVSLDTMPESREMIDWIFRDGEAIPSADSSQASQVTGGNVMRQMITSVDRNGVSNEVSPGYSDLWIGGLLRVVDALAGYEGYPEMDLYNNPRFIKMLSYQGDIILSRRSFPAIGDTGATALNKIEISTARLIPAFENTRNPLFAQMIYFLNGNKSDGLHYSVYQKNPNSLQKDIQSVISEYGEYDFDRSLQLPGYGFAALRSGSLYELSGNKSYDTQRTFWMFYGRGAGHGHLDSLNLGIEAMGLNLAPDLGYPRNTTADDYYNWGQTTVSHNTVVVNDAPQKRIRTTGVPYHFDDSGRVKVMDADTAHQYNIDTYRRTVVSIDVDNEFSYGIDFFRVKGGNQHVYSFHALSDTIAETEGLDNLVAQKDADGNYIGSYAGPDVPFRTEKIASGYSYLRNVDRAANVSGGNFMVDFKITDFRNQLENSGDMHLRMTMLNGFDLNEVAITNGDPPPRDANPETLKYVLARRSGSNLDTLFTTVFEPYEGERYIANIENISNIKHADGSALIDGETVRAVKVTLENGRIDYIVYAADNTMVYLIDDLFQMRGFVGVYTMQDGINVYSYVNDGDKIGDITGTGCVTGTVTDFTKDLAFENSISIKLNESIDPQSLVGKYIYINKTGSGNAAYEIKGVSHHGSEVILDIGDITLIDTVNANGYVYNIESGQNFRIPLTVLSDSSPVFDPVDALKVEAGSELNFFVHAVSPIDRPITYSAIDLPRGAQFDTQSGKITWIPGETQVGSHHVAIRASNGVMESIIDFTIQVHNKTTGDSPDTFDKDKDTGTTKPPVDTGTDPTHPAERFDDLDGYSWAQDAINQLAEDGIIKGTAPSLFSPGKDITRADFTILMVRALKLEGEAEQSFADVSADDYFAKEISIAKRAGIIQGSGENRFHPRDSITRQDMMTIIARALKLLDLTLQSADESVLNNFLDHNDIASYARDAVALLVTNQFITGDHGNIFPQRNTTRAEVAVLLHRILYVKK